MANPQPPSAENRAQSGPGNTAPATPGPDPAQAPATRFTVREYRPGDERWLIETYESTFDRERSLDEWRWLFEVRPGGPSAVTIHIVESDGRPVGANSHIGMRAWVQKQELLLGLGVDMMVLPEFRGRGAAGQLAKTVATTEHPFDLNFGSVAVGSREATRRGMGTSTLGAPPVWVRSLPDSAERSIRRRLTALAGSTYSALVSWPRPSTEVVDLETPGSEVDDLARDSATFATCIRVRDAAYLRWHWLDDPRTAWRIRAVKGKDGALRGYAVIGRRDRDDDRQGVIVDLLARDYRALRALATDAWEQLIEAGCVSVSLAYRDPRPWPRFAMVRAGFRRSRERGHEVACGPLSPRASEVVAQIRSWYLTGADTDL